MLTQTLRELERDGMITRHVFPTRPPGVEYRLSPLGDSALGPLAALVEWAEGSRAGIRSARERFDAGLRAGQSRGGASPGPAKARQRTLIKRGGPRPPPLTHCVRRRRPLL